MCIFFCMQNFFIEASIFKRIGQDLKNDIVKISNGLESLGNFMSFLYKNTMILGMHTGIYFGARSLVQENFFGFYYRNKINGIYNDEDAKRELKKKDLNIIKKYQYLNTVHVLGLTFVCNVMPELLKDAFGESVLLKKFSAITKLQYQIIYSFIGSALLIMREHRDTELGLDRE